MSEAHIKILVVDDDPVLRQLLADFLNRQGYDTLMAADGVDLQNIINRFSPDLVVLDRMLPCGDGLEVCRQLREHNESIPIIMLTAKDEVSERVIGLRAGADDYVGKPFDPRELLARVEVVLRRKSGSLSAGGESPVTFGSFTFDPLRRKLLKDNEPVRLTGGEVNLLEILVKNRGKPLSREKLLNLVRNDYEGDCNNRSIDIAILRLRRIIEDDPKDPKWIQTVWGVGYYFAPEQ